MERSFVIIATILLPCILVLLSVSSAYHGVLSIFRHIFPPARFYVRAMRALDKLESLSYKQKEVQYKLGVLTRTDLGFNELVKALHEKRIPQGDVSEIWLQEDDIPGYLTYGGKPVTPIKRRLLILVEGENKRIVLEEQDDPTRTTRYLKDWVEEITHKRVAYYMLVAVGLWLILNIYLQVFVY